MATPQTPLDYANDEIRRREAEIRELGRALSHCLAALNSDDEPTKERAREMARAALGQAARTSVS